MVSESHDGSRWFISREQRQQAVERLMSIVRSDDNPLAIRAARVLIAMDAANGDSTEDTGSEERLNRFKAILERIRREG